MRLLVLMSEYAVILSILLFISIITFLYVRIKIRNKKWEQAIIKSGILDIDRMSGYDFEEYLRSFLKSKGYKVKPTPASGDYGADLILSNSNKRVVVQAKRYSNKVGISAVQEIVSAKNYYYADECWVITNNYYTNPAQKLAASNDVRLIDREDLIEWISSGNVSA